MTQKHSSAPPGMGAILHPGGIAFRVWAPHADAVFVVGTFNDWSGTSHPMTPEDHGYWITNVAHAQTGDAYKYLIVNGEQRLFRNDPYAREVTHSAGNSILIDTDFDWGEDDFTMPAWNDLIIYELHVGTFNAESNDSPGTFRGVIDKLPYLRELGVNAIQIMPPMEFPGGYSWGYNPSHLFAPESDYGGVAELKALIKAAHAHRLAVIMDVVYNHFGPSDLDLWQFDGWSENGMGGIYFYNDWRAVTPWGDTRPDYGRGEVRQFIRDNALMWLTEYRVDGLRWDTTAYMRNVKGNESDPANDLAAGWSLMQWINEEIQARFPCKLTIAEDMRGNAWLVKSPAEGGAGFGSQWDNKFVYPVRQAIITNDDAFRDMNALRDAIRHRYNGNAFRRVIYTESHDEVANGRARVPEEIWPGKVDSWFSKKRSTLGAALVLTAPGIPMLFQGQEFIEDRWFHDRDPLEWSRVDQFRGILELYKSLIRLRRNIDATTQGLRGQYVEVHHLNDEAKMIAFHRWDAGGPGDSVVVVVNMANKSYEGYTIGFPMPGLWKTRFNSDASCYSEDFANHSSHDVVVVQGESDGFPFQGRVSIGPYTAVIFSQDKP